ncbi:MAG: hypothetical protein LBI64_08730 [Coriobacteriales bacterium]|jgi:hypothetical protein|nr:hypothetical protein [Coriobacteriales bacterium]
MADLIQQNPYLFAAIFAAACIVFIVLRVVISHKTKEQKTAQLADNGDLAELIFDCPVIVPSPEGEVFSNPAASVYMLYAVNGRPPQAFGHSVLVSPGKVTLDYEFYLLKAGHKRIASSFGRKECTLTVLAQKKYAVKFDYMDQTLMQQLLKGK